MKRCNCQHPLPSTPGPVQHTGSMLYPDVGPRPMPYRPMPPAPPVPIPEPCPFSSENKTVIVDGIGDVTVTKEEGVYDTTYHVSFDGFEKRYELQPFSQEELTEIFDSVDDGGI